MAGRPIRVAARPYLRPYDSGGMKRIAINGFGRIGRLVYRILTRSDAAEVAAVNDLADPAVMAHLLQYDTAHGRFDLPLRLEGDMLHAGNRKTRILAVREPEKLPWGEMGIDLVLECTGVFTHAESMERHLRAGARKVLLSAPPKGGDVPMFVLGVNDHGLTPDIALLSNASCTTNCLAPVVKVLDEHFGILYGNVTTTHAYTADQRLQDAPHDDLRRARAAAMNIVPTSTGAARALSSVYPPASGKLNAMAFRVPVITGSLIDLHVRLERVGSRVQINEAFREEAEGPLKGIIQYTEAPLVSSDIVGNPHSAIVDGSLTHLQDDLVRVVAWYDNETGYATRLADMAIRCLGA